MRLSVWLLGHKRLVFLFWLAVTVAGVVGTAHVSARLSQEFALPGQPGYEANQDIIHAYGNGGAATPLVAVLTAPQGSTVDDPYVRERLHAVFARLAGTPGTRVASYPSTGDRRFVAANARTTYALVFPSVSGPSGPGRPPTAPAISGMLTAELSNDWGVRVTGLNELAAGGGEARGPGVLTETLLGGLGALVVLAFVFGSMLALVPLLIATVSITTTFLIIYGLTLVTEVNFIVQFLVALIGLGVAIDYSLLLVTRWREELAEGRSGDEAIHAAMVTAGRAVLFSGATVAIGLVCLVFLPVPFLRSVGYAGMLIPLVSVLVTLTLLPVLLATVGGRLDWPRRRRGPAPAGRGWSAWARGVIRLRWLAVAVALACLVPLGVAAFGLKLGTPRVDALAKAGPAYEGLTTLERGGLPTGIFTPIEVLVTAGTDPAEVVAHLVGVPGVYAVSSPRDAAWRTADTVLINVQPVAETSTDAGKQTIGLIRQALADTPGAQVGGVGPQDLDFERSVYDRFPLILLIVVAVTFVLLVRAFRSLLLPLKAVVLNLLSVGAIYGVLVIVWQNGHGSGLWGIPATGSINAFVPLLVFAFLYGLSMDYEVFILARMREEYDRSGNTTSAIVAGIGRTGRLVTSASLILFAAFAALASGPQTTLKVFATGLAVGILLDATIVRALLVPALVSLFGRWNWWLPTNAARLLRVTPSPVLPRDSNANKGKG